MRNGILFGHVNLYHIFSSITNSLVYGKRRVRGLTEPDSHSPFSVSYNHTDRETKPSASGYHASHSSYTNNFLVKLGFGPGLTARRRPARIFLKSSSRNNFHRKSHFLRNNFCRSFTYRSFYNFYPFFNFYIFWFHIIKISNLL